METGFKQILGPKGKEKKGPWDFRCPTYDNRSSCYMAAGSHLGVGHKNPIGHTGEVKQRVETLPYGRVATPTLSHVPPKKLDQEYIE